ncbi:MAG: hypothetical protein ACTH5B_03575 [Marinomonas sp.]
MDKKTSSIGSSAIKVLNVMKTLKGHTLSGLSNGDIAKQLNMRKRAVNHT